MLSAAGLLGGVLLGAAAPLPGEGDAMPAPLTAIAGDAGRGRAIVASRQQGLCLLCHAAPIPEERFQGSLAHDLRGVASRLTEGQIRLRLVDSAVVNPDTIMPPYRRREGLHRVGRAFQGRGILTDAQIEDVVAWLVTLRED